LLVVDSIAFVRGVIEVSAGASDGAVHDAVLEREVLAELQRGEELVVGGHSGHDGVGEDD
jgi:hypothetical protein